MQKLFKNTHQTILPSFPLVLIMGNTTGLAAFIPDGSRRGLVGSVLAY